MKHFFLLFVILFSFAISNAQNNQGKVIEQLTIKSSILNREVKYTMYLPPDYNTSERSYPIVYLLHGYGDDNTGWLQFGEINRYADAAINNGTIPPMIIAMPDGGVSFYINSFDGATRYEDFFIKEFMPAVEKEFRIKKEKRYRGIAGLSMGGYGTLIYALKYPQLFAAAAPLSAAVSDSAWIENMTADNYNRTFAKLYGNAATQQERLTDSWRKNSILDIIESKPADTIKQVRFWIDCGDDDFLTIGNSMLHIALTKKSVPHEFRMRDGAHTWTYWRTGITDALQFIGQSFHQY